MKTHPRVATLLLLAAAACGGDSPTAPTAYDLEIELTNIFVVGDCEDTPGNPGEFAWEVRAESSVPLGGYAVESTNAFPAESGALSYSEDNSPIVLAGTGLRLTDIAAADVDKVLLRVSAIEWDGGQYDSRMPYLQSTGMVPGPSAAEVPHAIDVGNTFSCMLSFEFVARWTSA